MKYSQLFGKTIKDTPKDSKLISHQLLYQGGFIRESTAGRYYFLPLGERVQNKIIDIVRKHMDKSDAQEILMPIMHPLELWEETNRTTTAGFEIMKVKDRRGAFFVPGGTAEEMVVDLVRKFNISYKDLPFNIYQFSMKFRDELRARGGLLRVREFIMKDAYSFGTEAQFKKIYQTMWDTYIEICEELGLKADAVASDNGYIGGEYCHEFVVESEAGESKYFITEDGKYAAHEDVALFTRDKKNLDEELLPLQEVEAVRGTTMEDGVNLHKKPLWLQIKDVLFVDDKGRFILAIIRGDYDVNETKLMHIAKAYTLRHATEEEIREKLHSEPGFISPVGIKEITEKDAELLIVADESLHTIKNAYGGANKKHKDLFNMNIGRDYQADIEGDIALAKADYFAPDGKQKLIEKRGIEVGNIFQLGYHYTTLMKDSEYTDESGKRQKYYMGCYGFGIGRALATIVEKSHDDRGIVWPESVSPFQVHLISLKENEKAEKVYHELLDAGVEVLYDDREDVSAGAKFADADLIGIPVRLVISAKTGEKIEFKKRTEKETELLPLKEIFACLKA
jgi:prolyl-tRNA synthetase